LRLHTTSLQLSSENSSEAQREEHEDEIISIVRRSLVDNAANVRAAAAVAFDVLQDVIGAKAIDETIPTLLEALRQPGESSGTALQALREVMNVSPSMAYFQKISHLFYRSGRLLYSLCSFRLSSRHL
jgi:hypothetical protein